MEMVMMISYLAHYCQLYHSVSFPPSDFLAELRCTIAKINTQTITITQKNMKHTMTLVGKHKTPMTVSLSHAQDTPKTGTAVGV
jgi:hypothetical protein